MTEDIPERDGSRPTPIKFGDEFVVADPHVVYYDAVRHSPWNHDGGGHLPERDDWSTYRYTVKDIILGIATHRFNKNNRRLEIRSYFVGEHPIFKEFEPTKAMVVVFCCQSYQSGGSLELYFDHGIPFDIRELIDRRLGIVISGHETLLGENITRSLFGSLSEFSPEVQKLIAAQSTTARNSFLDKVCYNTYRGTWTANQIKSLIQRRIPLRWLFERRSPISNPLLHSYLINHLRAVLLEEYAVRHLENRQMGSSFGNRITRVDSGDDVYYKTDDDISLNEQETLVEVKAGRTFCLFPIVPHGMNDIRTKMKADLLRAKQFEQSGPAILVVPMDFIYLPDSFRREYLAAVTEQGMQLIVGGLTLAQLLSEAEFNLSITATEMDSDELELTERRLENVDRYSD